MSSSTTEQKSSSSKQRSPTSTSRTTKFFEDDGVPTVRRPLGPQVTHRGEGSNYVLPASHQALEPPVPMSPDPKPSEDAAETGAETEFEMINNRSDLTADEKLDTMLQARSEEQEKKAADEARQRVFGTRNVETPGKNRSRSPSNRTGRTEWIYDGRRTPDSSSPSFREYERQRSLMERRQRGELDSKFRPVDLPEKERMASRRSLTRSREDPAANRSPVANAPPDATLTQLAAAEHEASLYHNLLQREMLQQRR